MANIGNFVYVSSIDHEAEIATIELPDGTLHPLELDEELSDLEEGDVLALTPNGACRVNPEKWTSRPRVGVVKAITSNRIVVEVAHDLSIVQNPKAFPVEIGNTVLLNMRQEIQDILAASELRTSIDELSSRPVSHEAPKLMPGDPSLTWSQFGGYSEIVQEARELIDFQLKRRADLKKMNIRPIKGVILEGPPGTGKTFLGRIMAQEAGAAFYLISGPQIIGSLVGESERALRDIFDRASRDESAIIFFDELDSVAGKRGDKSHEHSDRLVATLLTAMQGFEENGNVLVLATTNRVEDIDPALRRAGRFDSEITFGDPTLEDRLEILRVGARSKPVGEPLSHEVIAGATEGWTAADLESIWNAAAISAIKSRRLRILDEDYALGYEVRASKKLGKKGAS